MVWTPNTFGKHLVVFGREPKIDGMMFVGLAARPINPDGRRILTVHGGKLITSLSFRRGVKLCYPTCKPFATAATKPKRGPGTKTAPANARLHSNHNLIYDGATPPNNLLTPALGFERIGHGLEDHKCV